MPTAKHGGPCRRSGCHGRYTWHHGRRTPTYVQRYLRCNTCRDQPPGTGKRFEPDEVFTRKG